MPLATSTKMIGSGYVGSSPFESVTSGPHPLAPFFKGLAYDLMYSQGLWPANAVDKLTTLQVVLPHKTYDRSGKKTGRDDGSMSPFGRLMAKPSRVMNPYVYRRWMTAMHHIYGAAFALKRNNRGRGPIDELEPVHPSRMRYGPRDGSYIDPSMSGIEEDGNRWWLRERDGTERQIARPEFFFWPRFSPSSPNGWLSPFEPLRETLESEHTIRRANRAMWRNGGRHQIALTHPSRFNNPNTTAALRAQYAERYAGVDNDGKPLVLQEGMKVEAIPVAQELAYVDTRRLNREEVASRFDIPPPAIGILDNATFTNIETQVRMLYAISIPPHVTSYEAAIEFDVRDGSFGMGPPMFGDNFYHEVLLDGALRGDFETRIDTYAKAIQTGQMTPAEARENENREYREGSDRLLVNAALTPMDEIGAGPEVDDGNLPDDGTVVDEGISTLSLSTASGPVETKTAPLTVGQVDTVMGRSGRARTLDDVDLDFVTKGLPKAAAAEVSRVFVYAKAAGGTVAQFREAIKELSE